MKHLVIVAMALCAGAVSASGQTIRPGRSEADFVLKDFRFASGESLPELRLHYLTIGTPKRNAAGRISNGVLLLHGTGG